MSDRSPIDGFDLHQYVDRTKHSKYLGKTSKYAIAATWLALKDAGIEFERNEEGPSDRAGQCQLKGIDPFQAGVILGVGVEAMDLLEHYHERFLSRGPRSASPFGLPNIYMSAVASHVARQFTFRGSSYAVSTACASATHAMINSFLRNPGGNGGSHGHGRGGCLYHTFSLRRL